MKRLVTPAVVVLFAAVALGQQPQIPTLQVCNGTRAAGGGTVHIEARKDAAHSGNIDLKLEVGCDPAGTGFPAGALTMRFSLSDSLISGMTATTIEQMTTTGKHTPTMFLNGRCMADEKIPCHYWLLLANNRADARGTPDIVSVLVVNKQGARLTYGTGPLVAGDINVAGTGF